MSQGFLRKPSGTETGLDRDGYVGDPHSAGEPANLTYRTLPPPEVNPFFTGCLENIIQLAGAMKRQMNPLLPFGGQPGAKTHQSLMLCWRAVKYENVAPD